MEGEGSELFSHSELRDEKTKVMGHRRHQIKQMNIGAIVCIHGWRGGGERGGEGALELNGVRDFY